MAQPIMPHPFRSRRGGRWGLALASLGACLAFFYPHDLGRYGIVVVCAACLVGMVLDELTSKRAP